MKPQPTISAAAADGAAKVDVVAREHERDDDPAENHPGAGQPPEGAPQRSSEECLQRGAGELSLWNETAHRATLAHQAQVRKVSARSEHDRGAGAVLRELGARPRARRCREAARRAARRPDQLLDRAQRGTPVLGLADHVEALGLEQHAGARPEARVIVDDEDGPGHCKCNCERRGAVLPIRIAAPMIRPGHGERHRANRSAAVGSPRVPRPAAAPARRPPHAAALPAPPRDAEPEVRAPDRAARALEAAPAAAACCSTASRSSGPAAASR